MQISISDTGHLCSEIVDHETETHGRQNKVRLTVPAIILTKTKQWRKGDHHSTDEFEECFDVFERNQIAIV